MRFFRPRHPYGALSPADLAAAVLDRVGDAVLVLDDHYRVVTANEPFLRWVESPGSGVLGRPVADFWEEPGRWADWIAAQRLQAGGSGAEALELRTKGGDPVPVEARLWSSARKQNAVLVLVLRDLRPQKSFERLLGTDDLTGVGSRTTILHRLEDEVTKSQKVGTPLGIVLLDIDGFKALNDLWGPSFGDQVLRVVGAELRDVLRSSDGVGRWASEEFLVVMPLASLERAEAVADRLRQGLERRLFVIQGTEVTVTASFGVTLARAPGLDTVATVLARVDQALDQAQKRGCNRVEFSP